MKKSISILLLATIYFQSCAVYYDTSISISEAVDKGAVLVTTKNGQTHQYKNIFYRDSIYYGSDDINTSSIFVDLIPIKSSLDTAEIYSIQLKDIKKSNKRQYIGGSWCVSHISSDIYSLRILCKLLRIEPIFYALT